MKKKEWCEGLDHIDPDLVEQYVEAKDRLKKPKGQKGVWLRLGVVAACLMLVVSAVIVLPMLREDGAGVVTTPDGMGGTPSPDVPVWDGAQYTAADIAKMFDSMATDGELTNSYTTIYVPDAKYLYVDQMADPEYLGVYQYGGKGNELNEREFETFIDGFLPQLEASLHMDLPQYEIEEDRGYREDSLSAQLDSDPYFIQVSQYETHQSFSLSAFRSNGDRRIILDGETVQVDQRLSDAEMISSVQSIKNKLCDIFNVSYGDTRIIRSFDSYSQYGAKLVRIYFYDEDAHSLNSMQEKPLSDYICITFDNISNYADDTVSDGILTVADIRYVQRRDDVREEYAHIANAKRISLDRAETLLYNGYVFGGHSCPLCMAAQEKVSFEGYDFVDIEYVFGYDLETNKTTLGIPFYAFYKKIGTSQNGNSIYAKTYVASIEVDGYEEYFKAQEEDHRDEDADLVE